MALPRFYHPQLLEGRVLLSPAESTHARQSRRLRTGDPVTLFDGAGRQAYGVVVESPAARPLAVQIDRLETIPPDRPRIILATALPKGPRQDVLFEKCTELGVDVILPVLFERSIVKPHEAKAEKWRRTCLEAAKQCGRAWLPTIENPTTVDRMIAERPGVDATFYGDTDGGTRHLTELLVQHHPTQSTLIAIGPEGGFTDVEITAMREAGILPAALGPHVLRIETAAFAAVTLAAAWRQSVRKESNHLS
jgi:16S rRNA (uracil1498-N3)-methyltransferase